ncbi:MAG: NAD(P)/FAD-dependent oxidoreductase [Burkholderiales bacterium]|nr:NAD(P)/FAD-dependent oxidoreductase [Burkholderiales bacterium]
MTSILKPGLTMQAEQARHDLERLLYPAANWVQPSTDPEGRPVLDVLVVGAGMCGQSAAFGLLRAGVRNLRVIDREARGREGPWGTFARMLTLRSPKHLTGPDLGIGTLTFRAWYEAQHGAEGWASLYKIPTLTWRDYLLWVRDTVGIAVENRTALVSLKPEGDGLRATLEGPGGQETVHARKVVLALGREGSGSLRWPRFPSFDPRSPAASGRVLHASTEFPFAPMAGKRVAVLGAGATGFDNAATALDAGAAQVTLFARRTSLPQVNKSKWTSFPGFFHGFINLPDEWRWKFLTHVYSEQVPPPHESVLRCDGDARFAVRLGEAWTDLVPGDDAVRIETIRGSHVFDYAILATGFDVDLMERAELAAFRGAVRLWRDRVDAAEASQHAEASRFPYLGAGFELMACEGTALPSARNVHLFNWGSAMSHGQLAGDIPGLAVGVDRLVQAIASDLFVADAKKHHAALLAHAEPELKTTRYYVAP